MRSNFAPQFLVVAAFSIAAFGSEVTAATVASVLDNTCFGFAERHSSPANRTVLVGGGGSSADAIGRSCGTFARAIAGGGFAGITAKAVSKGRNSTVFANGSWSDTFSVTAPNGYTGGPIDVGVAFNFDALIFQNVPRNATSNTGTSASYTATFNARSSRPGTNPQNATFSRRLEVLENRPSDPSLFALDIPSVTLLSVLPGTDTLSISISISALVAAFAPDGLGEVLFDGFNTASLAKNGPAFILPDGFFVTNEAANVYNNYWIDPRIPPTPSSVPLPAGLPLLLVGLCSLALVRLRSPVVAT